MNNFLKCSLIVLMVSVFVSYVLSIIFMLTSHLELFFLFSKIGLIGCALATITEFAFVLDTDR